MLSNQYFHSQTRSTAKLPNHIIGCHNWIHNYLMLYLSSFFAHNLCGLMPVMLKMSFFCIHIVFLDLIFLPTLLLQTPPASWPREVFVISYICLYFSVFVFAYICIYKYFYLSCVHIVQPLYSKPASWILVQYNEVPESW